MSVLANLWHLNFVYWQALNNKSQRSSYDSTGDRLAQPVVSLLQRLHYDTVPRSHLPAKLPRPLNNSTVSNTTTAIGSGDICLSPHFTHRELNYPSAMAHQTPVRTHTLQPALSDACLASGHARQPRVPSHQMHSEPVAEPVHCSTIALSTRPPCQLLSRYPVEPSTRSPSRLCAAASLRGCTCPDSPGRRRTPAQAD